MLESLAEMVMEKRQCSALTILIGENGAALFYLALSLTAKLFLHVDQYEFYSMTFGHF